MSDTRGHVWKLDEDGQVDMYAHEFDPHSGPRCVVCDYCYCTGCQRGPSQDCPGALGVARQNLEGARDELARCHQRILDLPAEIDAQAAEVARLESLEKQHGN